MWRRKTAYNWGNHFFRIAENIPWYFFTGVPNISSYIIHLNPIQVSWKLLNQKFFPFCWWLVSEQMASVYFLWDSSYCAKSCLHLTQISTLIGSLNKTSSTDLSFKWFFLRIWNPKAWQVFTHAVVLLFLYIHCFNI